MSELNQVLPLKWLIGGMVSLLLYFAFVFWVVVTVWTNKGAVESLVVLLSIALPMKYVAAPKIIAFLKSKKV